jgi:hypothetical protein
MVFYSGLTRFDLMEILGFALHINNIKAEVTKREVCCK